MGRSALEGLGPVLVDPVPQSFGLPHTSLRQHRHLQRLSTGLTGRGMSLTAKCLSTPRQSGVKR